VSEPYGLVRTVGGQRIHRDTCRYATSPSAVRWDWADGREFAEVRAAAAETGLELCTRCHPVEGDGRVRTAGAWYRPFWSGHANPIVNVDAPGGLLVFDPPDILFVPGGTRIRMENFETDRPTLAVERFDRTVERYRMRYIKGENDG
jgi:hypothetical protein